MDESEKRAKLGKHTSEKTGNVMNTETEKETEDAGVQTDLDIVELEEKQERVMNLMEQAYKILGFDMEDIEEVGEDEEDDEFEDDVDLFEYE